MHEAHNLMPPELAAQVPVLYSQEHETDPVVYAKYFTPDGSWTWFLTEYDPENHIAFGLVDGLDRELGYFSLDELAAARGPMGLPIERDLWFTPRPLSQVRRELQNA